MNPVFPSILSTDFYDLKDKLNSFKKGGIEFIHLDIMDGHFVD
ncbi:MAG: ribulose-phosphate 3-epimerase, partial [Candidatus Aminicenantes bacterium]|nr:ribulose-phosphate 3-epimerase [Candidatus Aminicenantes bacterium]